MLKTSACGTACTNVSRQLNTWQSFTSISFFLAHCFDVQFWLLVLLSHFSITEKKVSNCGKSGSETKGTLMLMSTAILGAMRAWLAGCAPCWQVWHPAFPCLHLNVHIIIGERLLLYSSDSVGSDYAQVKALRCFYLLKLLLTLLPQCSAPV